ncbi:MAG TPA: outer membrane beta-barrel protein [Bacteroidales bacterium]|nr:outer membrane beta-barrel protein [Bacteroidales bacterium]
MQYDPKNLDQYFAESLNGFRQKPPDGTWQRLEADLLAARRHRRLILYRWTAAAAMLLIALAAAFYFTTITPDHQPGDQPLSQVQAPATCQPPIPAAPENDILQNITQESTPTIPSPSTGQTAEMITRTTGQSDVPSVPVPTGEPEIAETLVTDEIQKEVTPSEDAEIDAAQPSPGDNHVPDIPEPEQKNILTKPLTDFTFQDQPEVIKTNSRWSIGGSFAPVYAYRSIRIDAEELPPDVNPDINYYNSSEEPVYSYSGGVDVAVNMSDKWQFRTGLYLSSLGHSNQEVTAYEAEGVKDLLKVSSSTGVIRITTSKLPEDFVDNSVRRDSITDAVYINSSIRQSFTYLELPLLVRYALLDRRFGLNLTGGFSPGIMTNYQAQFTYEGERIDLDNESDFYSMILNSQVGLGINYKITGSLTLSLDPAFKYSLNSIRKDHSIEYHPYSISVFTGIRYSF